MFFNNLIFGSVNNLLNNLFKCIDLSHKDYDTMATTLMIHTPSNRPPSFVLS